jgi:hypothetical protein
MIMIWCMYIHTYIQYFTPLLYIFASSRATYIYIRIYTIKIYRGASACITVLPRGSTCTYVCIYFIEGTPRTNNIIYYWSVGHTNTNTTESAGGIFVHFFFNAHDPTFFRYMWVLPSSRTKTKNVESYGDKYVASIIFFYFISLLASHSLYWLSIKTLRTDPRIMSREEREAELEALKEAKAKRKTMFSTLCEHTYMSEFVKWERRPWPLPPVVTFYDDMFC